MKNNANLFVMILGGLLFIASPYIPDIGINKPQSQLEKSIQSALPVGSDGDMRIMANTLRLLANTISVTPEIEVDNASQMLKKSLNWSYKKDFNFEEKYPEAFTIVTSWYEENAEKVTDRRTLVDKWRELAEALD